MLRLEAGEAGGQNFYSLFPVPCSLFPIPYSLFPLLTKTFVVQLVKAAEVRGGKLSVTQGVVDTGRGFAEVEATLNDLVKSGYVNIDNDPDTGVVVYAFPELELSANPELKRWV
ncbi:hypothetical protein [Coleofasciculus sp. F4-SAH-05]|uniref:hypothetical protein n=1 Tax=Coleofasciculus sp. F4-SAH-05 TaxID=3069525 RepID=UPI0032F74EE4